MKSSSLLKWTSHRTKCNKGKRNWIHRPEVLQSGHVTYSVKFLGNTEVNSPKGIQVVKEGIRKMKFNQHLSRAEGEKTPKVDLAISINGVTIQDSKTKKITHQYPLHRISYCADDKTDPKFFSFIAKEEGETKHNCFVFISEKLAEEIILTIGQAFDLAYKKFMETSGKDLELKKTLMMLQKRVKELENENSSLKSRLKALERKKKNNIVTLPPPPKANLLDINDSPIMNKKLQNLNLNKDDISEEDFNPRKDEEIAAKMLDVNGKDVFGFEPFNTNIKIDDPFSTGSFEPKELEQGIKAIDKKLTEMRDGFSRGLSFGNDSFLLESLDPLN